MGPLETPLWPSFQIGRGGSDRARRVSIWPKNSAKISRILFALLASPTWRSDPGHTERLVAEYCANALCARLVSRPAAGRHGDAKTGGLTIRELSAGEPISMWPTIRTEQIG
jgi:hypothetical protein